MAKQGRSDEISSELAAQAKRLGLAADGVLRLALAALNAQQVGDAERLVAVRLDELDLNDPSIYTTSGAARHLSSVGASMTERYMRSHRLFLLERVDYEGRSYLALGTRSGPHPRDAAVVIHVFAAPVGMRTIKDAGSDLVTFQNGRQLVSIHEQGDSTCFIRFIDLEARAFWRLWVEADVDGRRYVPLRFKIESDAAQPRGFRVMAPAW